MKQAIFSLLIFFIIVTGIVYYFPKLHFVNEVGSTFLHDKPLACQICGALTWSGAQAHSCAETFEETN